jgi:beta-N-acetylhexosaminidase
MDLTNFSDEQLAGQRLMAGFDGTGPNQDLFALIDTLKVGGIILFARNIGTPHQLKSLCRSIQNHAKSCHQPPLLIAIDQEGGPVARLREPHFTEYPGNSSITTPEAARQFAEEMASQLSDLGINMNMAPVIDVAVNTKNSIMAKRVFGSDPHHVSKLGCTVINTFQQNSIMAVAKHFPGIGRTVIDSHLEMPCLDADQETLLSADLIPFVDAIKTGVTGIMLSHILFNCLDPIWPASLSVTIAKEILRDRLGFEGLVITDDLDMGAIKPRIDIGMAIRQILQACIDMALICHKGPDIKRAHQEVLKGIKSSEKIRKWGEESVARIMDAKKRFLCQTP